MKKKLVLSCLLVIVILLSGCSKNNNVSSLSTDASPGVTDISGTADNEAQDKTESTSVQAQNNDSNATIDSKPNTSTTPSTTTPAAPEVTDNSGTTSPGWDTASYTGFLSEQITGKNTIKISTYSKWLGTADPKNIWPIATDDESDDGVWKATVTAYDASKNILGNIEVPASAGGMVDYTDYVSGGIKYIRVTQGSGSDSGYIAITVSDAT